MKNNAITFLLVLTGTLGVAVRPAHAYVLPLLGLGGGIVGLLAVGAITVLLIILHHFRSVRRFLSQKKAAEGDKTPGTAYEGEAENKEQE